MSGIRNVLFLCDEDCDSGLMAQAILAREGAGRFRAYQAGLHPQDGMHPLVEGLLRKLNHGTAELSTAPLQTYWSPQAPVMDFLFTLSESLREQTPPRLPGPPLTAHWGVPELTFSGKSDAERTLAVAETYRMLSNRIGIFVNLPMTALDRLSLQRRLGEIGAA